MHANPETAGNSKAMFWGGWVMSLLPAAFMLLDGVMKVVKPQFVIDGTVQIGYPESCIVPLGIVVTVITILYLIPQTAVLGAILLTGYLGGAVASHVRLSEGWFAILFPVVFGALLWGGLYLRDPRLRALVPWRT